MKNYIYLLSTGILLTITLCLPDAKNDSNWFKKCLETKSKMDRCIEFDLMISKEFVKKEENTAALSPIICDYNILIQCANNDFGSEYSLKSTDDLKFVDEQTKNMNHEKFKTLNCLYEKVEVLHDDIAADGYLYKFFTIAEAEKVYNEHVEWIIKESHGLLSSPLDYLSFESSERIYASLVYFKDNWAKKFDASESFTSDFYLDNKHKTTRKFMFKHDNYKYKKIEGEVEYEVVVIPYSEKNENGYKRYMVYLIPSKYDMDLSKLWDAFRASCKGRIQDFLSTELTLKEIRLQIPKLENLKSAFDSAGLLENVFKNNTAHCFSSKMVTLLNVDETGTEAVICLLSKYVDCCHITVKADRAHLSFIFDMESQRILFITKDTGIIKE
jgi:hypothetical protein